MFAPARSLGSTLSRAQEVLVGREKELEKGDAAALRMQRGLGSVALQTGVWTGTQERVLPTTLPWLGNECPNLPPTAGLLGERAEAAAPC